LDGKAFSLGLTLCLSRYIIFLPSNHKVFNMPFHPFDRDQASPPRASYVIPDYHLAKFVVLIVDQLNLSHINSQYKGRGKPAYPPSMMLALLIYSYINGIFSCKSIARSACDLLPVMYITCQTHPTRATISRFKKRFAPEIAELFVQACEIAKEAGALNLGAISLDDEKLETHASKKPASDYDKAREFRAKLEKEVEYLMETAKSADSGAAPGIDLSVDIEHEITLKTDKIQPQESSIEEIVAAAAKRYAIARGAHKTLL
jgi:transposase